MTFQPWIENPVLPSVAAAPDRPAVTRTAAAGVLLLMVVGAIFLALINPVSRDEGGYAGPAAVATRARIYKDFLYLQTPLQAELAPPLAHAFPGYGFLTLRLAVGLCGAGVMLAVYGAQRQLQADRWTALSCTALLGACYSFQFGCAVLRNDAFPALLATLGILLGLSALQGKIGPRWGWGLVGLVYAAATSAKISYAIPVAGIWVFLLAQLFRRQVGVGALVSFGLGVMAGLVPCAASFASAPEGFFYSTLKFSSVTAIAWYRARHMGWMVNPIANLLVTTGILLIGPALGALFVVVRQSLRKPRAAPIRATESFLLVLMSAGGVAALSPTPSNFQYAIPLLPPLFILLGAQSGARPLDRGGVSLGDAVTAIGVALGCAYGGVVAARGLFGSETWPALQVTREAHWIGDQVRKSHSSGEIVSLAPEVVLDSGYSLDPRFATGVFLYRSEQQVGPAMLAHLNSIGPTGLAQSLDPHRPVAIVVGVAGHLDAELRQFAILRGYHALQCPYGTLELFIRP